MKSTCQLIILSLLIHSFSFGQKVTNYGPFPKIANSTVNVNYLANNYILLNKYKHSDAYNGTRKKDDNYYILNSDSNTGFVSKKINHSYNATSGDVFTAFLTDEYIIEFISFVTPLSFKTAIGVVKRNPTTLETIGDVKILDEHILFSLSGPNANVQKTKDGYIYTRIVEDQYLISYLDANFNEVKAITLTDEVYKNQSSELKTIDVSPYSMIQVNEYDELLFTKLFISKVGQIQGFHFTIVSPDGTFIDINPKFELLHTPRGFHLNYLHDQKAIECIFEFGDAPKMKGFDIVQRGDEGYCYYKWDLDGNPIKSVSKLFSVDEVYGEYKEILLKKYDEKKLGNDILSNFSNSRVFFTNEGSYLLINGLTWNPELRKSTFIVKTDKNGNLVWSKMVASSVSNTLANFTLTSENHLGILMQDANSANSNGSHQVDLSKKVSSKENSSVFKIILDKTNGDIIENSLVELNLLEGYKIQQICKSQTEQKYLIESLEGKTIRFSVVEF